jgi:hypothetical protein
LTVLGWSVVELGRVWGRGGPGEGVEAGAGVRDWEGGGEARTGMRPETGRGCGSGNQGGMRRERGLGEGAGWGRDRDLEGARPGPGGAVRPEWGAVGTEWGRDRVGVGKGPRWVRSGLSWSGKGPRWGAVGTELACGWDGAGVRAGRDQRRGCVAEGGRGGRVASAG